MQRSIIIIIIICLQINIVFSQVYEKITEVEGLQDCSYNHFIYKDLNSFIWISSISGLYRFDGNNAIHCPLSFRKSGENIQSDFFEDIEGNLWFSVYEGIVRYNDKKEEREFFQIIQLDSTEINYNYRIFHFDNVRGDLFLRAGEKIFTFNILNKSSNFLSETKGEVFNLIKDREKESELLFAFPKTATNSIEVYELEKGELYCKKSIDFKGMQTVFGIVQYEKITNFLISEKGIFHLNIQSNQIENFYPLPFDTKVTDWEKEHEAGLLLATLDFGILRFDISKKKYSSFILSQNDINNKLLSPNPNIIKNINSNFIILLINGTGLNYSYIPIYHFKC